MSKINLKKLKLDGVSTASGNSIKYLFNEPISSNFDPLDLITGGGLFPGRIYLLSGEKSSGKSTLMLQTMGGIQKNGGIVAHAESENTIEIDRAEMLGVDPDLMLLSEDSIQILEEGFEWLKTTLLQVRETYEDHPMMLSWDTYQSTVTRAQFGSTQGGKKDVNSLRKEMDQFAGGRQEEARIIKTKLKELVHILNRKKAFLFLLSQVYENPNAFSSENRLVASGGHGLNHQVTTHIRVEKKGKIYHSKNKDVVVGHNVKLYTVKNKQAPPYMEMEVPLYFSYGFSAGKALHDFCVNKGLISGGSWTHAPEPFGLKDKESNKKFQLRATFGDYYEGMENYGIYHWFFILAARFYAEMFPTIANRYNKLADDREKWALAEMEDGNMKLMP